MTYLFLLGRVLLGVYFILSGWKHFKHLKSMTGYAASKNVPLPREGVMLTGLMMILGGLGVLLGVYVVWSIFLLVIFLLVITPQMHAYWKDTDPMTRMANEINFQKNLALLGALLMLLAIPTPWILSLF